MATAHMSLGLRIYSPSDMERFVTAFHEREDLALDLEAADERIERLEAALRGIVGAAGNRRLQNVFAAEVHRRAVEALRANDDVEEY